MADSDDRYRLLENSLQAARDENDLLADQAEQILLLGRVAEALLYEQEEDPLLERFLESISILKDIPYCAIFEVSARKPMLRAEYAIFVEGGASGAALDLPEEVRIAAQDGDGGTSDWPLPGHALRFDSFEPATVIALPFRAAGLPPSILVVADDRRGLAELRAIVPLLHEASRMAQERLSNLKLQRRLAQMNKHLSRKVVEAKVALRQAAAAFDNAAEGVVITDATQTILAVNRAFTHVTGYSADEAIGLTPRLLKSGLHDSAFYEAMWTSLATTGRWRGEVWNKRKDGSIYPEFLNITAVKDEDGTPTHYVALFSDITAAKESEARFEHLAHYDGLTELPNRELFREQLEAAVLNARRHGHSLAVAIVGIDGFKAFNETVGLTAGDELLRHIATSLREQSRRNDTVARLAGDEFVVLYDGVQNAAHAGLLTRNLLDSVARPFAIGPHEIFVTCSAGISVFPDDAEDAALLIRDAHVAFRQAKDSGRNSLQFCSEKMRSGAEERFRLEADLRHAVERRQLVLYYQPQYSVGTGQCTGLEALIRWNHPERGLVMPGLFIPIAEETGIIEALGGWALREACRQAAEWQRAGFTRVRIAVNLSPHEVKSLALADAVSLALAESGLDPQWLELELTEGSLVGRPERAKEILTSLKRAGVTLAIDDFGTGYSSLGYLKLLPVDRLKIDRSFINDLGREERDQAIARTIIMLAHGLGLRVVAEGVESEEQAAFLREHGCDEVQGFLYSRPVPASEVERLLRS